MTNESSSSNFSSGSPPNFSEKLSAAAIETKARAADLGRKATDTADQARTATAAGLSAAAGAIADSADKGADRARRVAHRTADALSTSADYIRANSVRDMMDDVMGVVKNNPGVALLGAVAVGFLVGRAFTPRN
jgi:hypothetical protein